MATGIQVVIDCADPARLARFWAEALGYRVQPPPEGFESWEAWLRDAGIPEEDWNSASAVVDPDGAGPRIYFQRVPERKQTKNRVHLDLNVGGSIGTPLAERQARVDAEVDRLIGLSAAVARPGSVERGEYWVVMQDPEGNEFCVQ
jgi:Glyoxalase-like domain